MAADDTLPAHASPALAPFYSPHAQPPPSSSDFSTVSEFRLHQHEHADPPPSLISPAFTPPATPGTATPALERDAKSVPVDTSLDARPRLVKPLPEVWCEVRARIPTTTGTEIYVHLYHNNVDNKEHLAIVFGQNIRSKSLDATRPGETERDRMVRGAYVGRLYPGRTTSRVEQIRREAGTKSAALKTALNGTAASSSSSSSSSSRPSNPSPSPSPEAAEEDTPPGPSKPPLVRIHSECYTGETVWSARCDCGEQLDEAARLMSLPCNARAGGVIIYLRQEGRGIGLGEKLKAYNLQDLGHDTYEANVLLRHPADARSYGLATAMLLDLGLGGQRGIRLLTNNPDKVRAVEGPGREVVVRERVAMVPLAWKTGGQEGIRSEEVEKYLSTKIEKFKHMIG